MPIDDSQITADPPVTFYEVPEELLREILRLAESAANPVVRYQHQTGPGTMGESRAWCAAAMAEEALGYSQNSAAEIVKLITGKYYTLSIKI